MMHLYAHSVSGSCPPIHPGGATIATNRPHCHCGMVGRGPQNHGVVHSAQNTGGIRQTIAATSAYSKRRRANAPCFTTVGRRRVRGGSVRRQLAGDRTPRASSRYA